MKIINWNISWSNAVDNKISYLKELVAEASFVIILQEVKMNSYEALKKAFADVAKIEYSLEYRAPGKYDTDSRIDANEPQYDHYEISKMKFFDNYNKGNGCKTFFESMQACGLMDAYVKDYDTKQHVEGEYLTTSHVIKRGNKKVRYDFVFVNEEKIVDYHCRYDYCNAVEAGSDHAAVIIDVCHG